MGGGGFFLASLLSTQISEGPKRPNNLFNMSDYELISNTFELPNGITVHRAMPNFNVK